MNNEAEAVRVLVNKELKEQVEINAEEVIKIVDEIVNSYVKELDEYVEKIRAVLSTPNENITSEDLDKILLVISANLYSISDKQEKIGIKQDIAEILADEKYDSYFSVAQGTVADKNAVARNKSKEDILIKSIYTRVYKLLKMKYEAGQKLSDSVKKVLSRRMQELELSRGIR